ncbi:probable receptor-like protein kinase At2g23200 [Rutidosis leptorrhynchoides]|uniref:probable receptor-like protein kinase At2g23200 n=1 Tax=Rutidosis leptorrhynchoides TaxID=125765 RepID=UPI003A99C2B5
MEPSLIEIDLLQISWKDIIQATNNFYDDNLIGIGGYGNHYRGELSRSEGKLMVVCKQFNTSGDHDTLRRLLMSQYKLRHENLVSLVGLCDEQSDEHIFIYEYMTRGSLAGYLSDTTILTWLKRVQICLDAARGLDFLHNSRDIHGLMVHSNLTSAKILLDVNWHAKIEDVSSSEKVKQEDLYSIFENAKYRGEIGYIDPLLFETGLITEESDVYSFGVILFEVLCGRRVSENSEDDEHLTMLARLHYEGGTLTKIIDPILRKQMNLDSLKTFSDIAYRCLEWKREARPKITEIVKNFETILRLQQEYETALAIQKLLFFERVVIVVVLVDEDDGGAAICVTDGGLTGDSGVDEVGAETKGGVEDATLVAGGDIGVERRGIPTLHHESVLE